MDQTQNGYTQFRKALHGIVQGQPVRVLAFGDVPGNSPSYLCLDSHGKSKWQSIDNVTIIDTDVAPLSPEYFTNFQNALSSAGGNMSSTGSGSTSRK